MLTYIYWHREAGQTAETEELYGHNASSGGHIPANRDRIPLPDEAPPDAEIRMAIKTLRNGRTRGGTMMSTEDIEGRLRRAEAEKKTQKEGAEGLEGAAGDTWRLPVRLIRHIWDTGKSQPECRRRLP